MNTQGWFPLGLIDWLDFHAVQGTLKSLLQHHNLKALIFQCSAFFMIQFSHLYMSTEKIIALTIQTFVSKLRSVLFNTLSRHPTPVLLPGKSHRQRSLVGCSPWGHEELDTTERLPFHFSLSYIGEWNGNPLQCSCLENPRDSQGNPRDGGALWAAVYRVIQSWTRLKWLSSSRQKYI